MKLYKLPVPLRKVLSYPQGVLFKGNSEESFPKILQWMNEKGFNLNKTPDFSNKDDFRIICVGDVVSKAVLEHPILYKFLKFCFIDGTTQRGEDVETDLSLIISKFEDKLKVYNITNPREHISSEIFDYIGDKIYDPFHYIVKVNGEEDLLVLPATLVSDHALIFYGQPPITALDPPVESGCVVVYSDEETRNRFQSVLDKFDVIDN